MNDAMESLADVSRLSFSPARCENALPQRLMAANVMAYEALGSRHYQDVKGR